MGFKKELRELKTIAQRGLANAKVNIPALAKNPLLPFAEGDPAWFQHSANELQRVVTFQMEMREQMAAQEDAAKKAREDATKEFARLKESQKPTRQQLLDQLEEAGPGRFLVESEVCNILVGYVKDFAELEFMRMTQKGQTALFGVVGLLQRLGEQAQASLDEYTKWKDQMLVSNMSLPAHETDYANFKAFEGRYSAEREAWVAEKLAAAAEVCADAIEFETVKAYVVERLEKGDDPDHVLNTIKRHSVTASGSVSAAGGLTPGQPGTIVSAAGAFVDAGTSLVDKMATSAIRSRRAKIIMASPDKELEVVKAMNEDSTIMAEYLRTKFVANLEFGLSQVKPTITGLALGLDAASFGVPAGNIVVLVWDTVVTAVVKVADRAHKRKIDLAKEKLKEARQKSDIAGKTASVWQNAADELKEAIPGTVEEAFEESTNVAVFGANWQSLSPPGRTALINAITEELIDPVLKRMHIPPADLWSGDDFVNHLNRLTTFRGDIKNKGYGVRAAS